MIDFSAIVKPVLLQILGEPNQQLSTAKELRFGRKGSLSVDPVKGIWSDFETGDSGGFFDLIKQEIGTDDPMQWLRQNGYATDTRGQSGKAQKEVSSLSLKPVSAQTKQAATYTYTTESGEPLYRVMRNYDAHGNRTFKQQRFDHASGQWLNGLKDAQGNSAVEKTLFNLPELVSRPNEAVHIVEGEKDVVTLHKLGLLSTTSGGSNSWKPEFAQWLRGRDVVVIPDQDSAGAKYADTVTQSLKGIAKSIKRIDLARHWTQCPPKGDVTDFIEAGASLDDLNRIIQQTPFEGEPATATKPKHLISFDELLAHQTPPEWLIKGVLLKTGSTLLFAESGAGKSFLAIDWALHIACGKEWQGKKTKAGCVAFVAGEGVQGLRYRVKAWVNHHQQKPSDNGAFHVIGKGYAINEAVELNGLIADLDSLPTPPNLVILDTLARTFSGDENHATAMGAYIKAVDFIRDRYQCSVLIIHHTGKADKATARGSNALKGAMDRELKLDANGDIKQIVDTKEKDGRGSFSFKFKLKDIDTGIIDEDGEYVTSAVIEATNDTAKPTKQLSSSLAFAIQTFAAVSYRHKADLSQWRAVFYEKHHGETVSAKKMAFNRARKELVEAKIMSVENDTYTLLEDHPYQKFTSGIMIAANFKKAQGEVGNDESFNEASEVTG